ncbi:MAG: hypothetical protein V4568_14495 [Pseudomonadota bacterium]
MNKLTEEGAKQWLANLDQMHAQSLRLAMLGLWGLRSCRSLMNSLDGNVLKLDGSNLVRDVMPPPEGFENFKTEGAKLDRLFKLCNTLLPETEHPEFEEHA